MIRTDHRRESGRRLAALGALSSAGLAIAGSEAEAGIVVTTVNQDIGFAAGDLSSLELTGLPTVNFNVLIARTTYPGGRSRSLVVSGAGVKGFQLGDFKTTVSNLSFASRFAKGATLNQAAIKRSGGYITIATKSGSSASSKFTDKYFLFSFKDASNKVLYGWIEGSLTDNTYDSMTYHLTSYAYDDTGAAIHAGDTGAAVPEPGTASLGLLGAALVGGAAGVRRWKEAKAEAANA